MTTRIQTLPAGSGHFSSSSLWAAIAVLGVAVIALGASLIHVQTRPVDGHSVFVPTDPVDAEPQAAATRLPVNTVAPDEIVVPARPEAATPAPATTPTDPQPEATPTAMPPATPSAANQDAGPAASVANAAPDAAPMPEAMPVPEPNTPAAPAPYVVTESGVVITGPPGQGRAKVYRTD